MSEAWLMNLGVFLTSILGYCLITFGLGAITSLGDEENIPITAWALGCLMYAITVLVMWNGL